MGRKLWTIAHPKTLIQEAAVVPTTSQVYRWDAQPTVNLNTCTLTRNLVPALPLLSLLATLKSSTSGRSPLLGGAIGRFVSSQLVQSLDLSVSLVKRSVVLVLLPALDLISVKTPPSERVRVLSEKNVLDKFRRSHDVVWDVSSLWSTRFSHVKTLERTRCRGGTPQLARREEGVV